MFPELLANGILDKQENIVTDDKYIYFSDTIIP